MFAVSLSSWVSLIQFRQDSQVSMNRYENGRYAQSGTTFAIAIEGVLSSLNYLGFLRVLKKGSFSGY